MSNMNSASRIGSPTWPYDSIRIPKDLARTDANHLVCFLACPLDERSDDLLNFIQSVCNELGRTIGANIECVRSDKISTPGTIHADIWKYIELSDALIFDVTGSNGNVLLELGVAASCRSQDNIVILRDHGDARHSKFLFDIAPSRHLLYNRSLFGSVELRRQLMEYLIHALTPAPYKPLPEYETTFPLEISLPQKGDPIDLLSPPMLHRRLVTDGLEFGSLYIFRNSWLTVGDQDHSLVKIEADIRFSDRTPNLGPADGWIGIALRSQHFFANYSHLVYVRPNGVVWHTEPQSESSYRDREIGPLQDFDLSQFVKFKLEFATDNFDISVNNVHKTIDLKFVPHVRHAGKIRLQTHQCRAVIKYVKVELINEEDST